MLAQGNNSSFAQGDAVAASYPGATGVEFVGVKVGRDGLSLGFLVPDYQLQAFDGAPLEA
jgi:hypothetical protein